MTLKVTQDLAVLLKYHNEHSFCILVNYLLFRKFIIEILQVIAITDHRRDPGLEGKKLQRILIDQVNRNRNNRLDKILC